MEEDTVNDTEHTILAVKHGDGNSMVSWCFSSKSELVRGQRLPSESEKKTQKNVLETWD